MSHENLGNSSKNRSIILGGQVDTNSDDGDDDGDDGGQVNTNSDDGDDGGLVDTNVLLILGRTLAKGTLGGLFGRKWLAAQFLLVASSLHRAKRSNTFWPSCDLVGNLGGLPVNHLLNDHHHLHGQR